MELDGRAEELELRIYTRGWNLAAVSKSGPWGPGWQVLPLAAEFQALASNGIYHYVVVSKRGSATSNEKARGKLAILK